LGFGSPLLCSLLLATGGVFERKKQVIRKPLAESEYSIQFIDVGGDEEEGRSLTVLVIHK
jgi:hypothetical protein